MENKRLQNRLAEKPTSHEETFANLNRKESDFDIQNSAKN